MNAWRGVSCYHKSFCKVSEAKDFMVASTRADNAAFFCAVAREFFFSRFWRVGITVKDASAHQRPLLGLRGWHPVLYRPQRAEVSRPAHTHTPRRSSPSFRQLTYQRAHSCLRLRLPPVFPLANNIIVYESCFPLPRTPPSHPATVLATPSSRPPIPPPPFR